MQLCQDSAGTLVEAFDHCGVGGVAVPEAGFQLALKMADIGGLGFDWRVRRVMGQIEKKRLVARSVDDAERLVCQPVGEILAWPAEVEVGHVTKLRAELAGAPVWPEKRLRCAPECAADVHIEPVGLGVVLRAAEVPFADCGGEVAGRLKMFGQCRFGVRQVVARFRLKELPVRWSVA